MPSVPQTGLGLDGQSVGQTHTPVVPLLDPLLDSHLAYNWQVTVEQGADKETKMWIHTVENYEEFKKQEWKMQQYISCLNSRRT